MAYPNSIKFDFYGFNLEVCSRDIRDIENIGRDFSYFVKNSPLKADMTIEIADQTPDYSAVPNLIASIYTMDYVVYEDPEETFTDFHGKGLRIYDRCNNKYRVYAASPDQRYEITNLTVVASVGRYLDSKHIHRVHALGLEVNKKAVLILLPEKGGKTTLALQLTKTNNIKMLSEECPLITRRGEILPFPIRMTIAPGEERDIPSRFLSRVDLLHSGPSLKVDTDYLNGKIGTTCRPWMVLVGERILGNQAGVKPGSRLKTLKELINNSVIGLGLHQGLEYLLGGNAWNRFGKLNLAISRLNNCIRVLTRSRVYRFQLGHDFELNGRVLADFIAKEEKKTGRP